MCWIQKAGEKATAKAQEEGPSPMLSLPRHGSNLHGEDKAKGGEAGAMEKAVSSVIHKRRAPTTRRVGPGAKAAEVGVGRIVAREELGSQSHLATAEARSPPQAAREAGHDVVQVMAGISSVPLTLQASHIMVTKGSA